MKIEEILARRSDLSTFLVHLTRATGGKAEAGGRTARENLEKILTDKKLSAQSPFGPAAQSLTKCGLPVDSQKAVCFTETPLEHTSLLIGEIEGRQCQFEPYGIAITRKQARKRGVNPVWYLDITPGHHWITNSIDGLISQAIKTGDFDSQYISKIAPFIEQMGSGQSQFTGNYRKEFWWEREWRHVGDLCLPRKIIILCPEDSMLEMQNFASGCTDIFDDPYYNASFVDPRWSLEQIIGHLAGFNSEDLGPF